MSRSQKIRRSLFIALVIAVLAAVAVIALGEHGLLPFPTPSFDDIFRAVGLKPPLPVPIDPSGDLLTVSVIDVGQGDSILLSCGGDNVLVDAGDRNAREAVLGYLDAQRITALSAVVMTHPDADHIGSMAAVIDALTVGKIIVPEIKNPPDTKVYNDLIDTVQRREVVIETAAHGTFSLGEAKVTVLPGHPEAKGTNNLSVALRIDYGKTSMLLTGDLEKAGERYLIEQGYDLDVDVYKAGHHGSKTSSSDWLLEAMTPTISVISAGEGNRYGHPAGEVVERLQKWGAVYRTDREGTIVLQSDKLQITVKTEKTAA